MICEFLRVTHITELMHLRVLGDISVQASALFSAINRRLWQGEKTPRFTLYHATTMELFRDNLIPSI